jgi:hypothetical protein
MREHHVSGKERDAGHDAVLHTKDYGGRRRMIAVVGAAATL